MIKHRHFCRPRRIGRRGLSLIEVIAATAVLAVMMVPMAQVIKSSRQSISRAADASAADQLRDASRWLRQSLTDGTLLSANSQQLLFRNSAGQSVTVRQVGSDLVFDDGDTRVVVLEDIIGVFFQGIRLGQGTGILLVIGKRDASSGQFEQSVTLVTLPPQFS